MSQPAWPEPQPDPDVERGEGEYGLLPSLDRMRGLSRASLLELREQVRDWEGPVVEQWRQRVSQVLTERHAT